MKPALIIHGHFYQPPRENPWTGMVDREPGAAPFHDWNARIHHECYRPNGHARIYDDAGAVLAIVNNYRRMSFNVGPTLASWLEEHEPPTYRRILDADRASVAEHGGHGNALAQAYNHAILPLMNDRDLRTQLRWGHADFKHRFGRDAEGMWLPETACDRRTLAALIDEGMRFAILAPGQAARVKDGDRWRDVHAIDPRRPYRFMHPDGSGRSLALFFYDGAVSLAIAFEGLLTSSRAFVDRLERASGGPGTLVHAVTDGESYGHHHRHGERCLAYALTTEAPRRGFWVTNYGELLDHLPPREEVDIALGPDGRGSSWSCAHGVGRWYRDCGCHTGGKHGWNQRWRTPLRLALDLLRDEAARFYEDAGGALCADPWALRDEYAALLCDRRADRAAFLDRHGVSAHVEETRTRALALLEQQRSAMTMYTSCGWFFSDVAGLEAVQVLRYAGRLVDQLRASGAPDPEPRFLEVLAEAQSNHAERGSGADLYREAVRGSRTTPARLAAHVSMRRFVGDGDATARAGHQRVAVESERAEEGGRMRLGLSKLVLTDEATGEAASFACCAMHFGGIDLHCLVKPYPGAAAFDAASERIATAVRSGSLLTALRVAQEELGPDAFGIEHVLPNEREALSNALFAELRESYGAHFEAMLRDSQATIASFREAGLPVPPELRAAAELALARRFDEALSALPGAELDDTSYRAALSVAELARALGCKVSTDETRRKLEATLLHQLRRLAAGEERSERTGAVSPLRAALAVFELASRLGVELELERAQEVVYEALVERATVDDGALQLADALNLSRELAQAAPRRG
ncbi:MAG: DUF3536 domain-containing protein [Deltaproteobacteria bacterium]|nr:DUF3536 domain-containing protein [Deltaproteobacteria bacterium]